MAKETRKQLIEMNENQRHNFDELYKENNALILEVRELSSRLATIEGVAQAAEQSRIKTEAQSSADRSQRNSENERMYRIADACLKIASGRSVNEY